MHFKIIFLRRKKTSFAFKNNITIIVTGKVIKTILIKFKIFQVNTLNKAMEVN